MYTYIYIYIYTNYLAPQPERQESSQTTGDEYWRPLEPYYYLHYYYY